MAIEDMFVAAAITMGGLLGFFIYMYHFAESWLWKRVWLMGCFLTAYMELGIMRFGFQHIVVITDLADLSFAAMQVLMWCIVALFGWLLLSLMYHGARSLIDAASGKKKEDGLGLGEV